MSKVSSVEMFAEAAAYFLAFSIVFTQERRLFQIHDISLISESNSDKSF